MKEDLAECAQISCLLQSKILMLCACKKLGKKIIKKRRVGGRSPRLGVKHVYPVLWLLCAFRLFICAFDVIYA